jgi:beta-lactamase class A
MFLRNTDLEDTSELVDSMGLEALFTNEGKISAKEFTRLLRTLYTSSYLKRENSEKILDLMTQASFREYLNQGFPPEVKFAHKFGQNKSTGVFADAGIVYLEERPYMLSVMIEVGEGKSEQNAIDLMNEISKKAYQYVNSQ